MKQHLDDILQDICDKDPRYHIDAYEFVLDSLSYAQKKFKRKKHVSGKELLEAIKESLMEEFGPMALTVLEHWGVHSTDDFGHIVFNLVSRNVLSKTEEDNIESFRNVFDFEHVFHRVYRHRLEKKISRLR